MEKYVKLSDAEKQALIDKVKQIGHDTETAYGSCAQSCLDALMKVFPELGITDELFTASYGLAGGCGCSLTGTCGALNGAALAISVYCGRNGKDMDGDYGACYEAIRKVVEPFKEKYNGVLCPDVMKATMGDVYDFKTDEGDKLYGEHDGTEHCSQAVAFAASKVAELIVNGEL
ncbi:MAG: C_GCAxxG_C_C family protein [Clostridiales bacterium]|nr:C_GCAxxG_C_C family protein [Clostridiales bacterium]